MWPFVTTFFTENKAFKVYSCYVSAPHSFSWPLLLQGMDRPRVIHLWWWFSSSSFICMLILCSWTHCWPWERRGLSTSARVCTNSLQSFNSLSRSELIVPKSCKGSKSRLQSWKSVPHLDLVLLGWPWERLFWCPGLSREKRATQMLECFVPFCKKHTHERKIH